ncbi:TetR family transcriptional regulator [Luteipulveratus mongoliensis]|uniref:TetR family transcriptional regulator n=1 Tax=Luteipulveratus mongoliensis TaxID=571913 RepID=UPI00146FE514|nr:TetR family transcriptional regulator [Luteipulveratus mongoliensis]
MNSRVKSDRRTTRWDEHREQRRAELVEAAVRAIDRLGPDASVAEMAAEAKASKPVLYRYFADKNEIHAAVAAWSSARVAEQLLPALTAPGPIRDRIAAGVDGYLRVIEEHPQVFLLLVHHRGDGDLLAAEKGTIAAALAVMLGDSLRSLGVDAAGAEPWAHGLVGLGLSTGEWWLERRTMSRSAVGRYLTELIWHAFAGIADGYGVSLDDLDRKSSLRAATPIEKGRR